MPVGDDWPLQFGPDAALAVCAQAVFSADQKPDRVAVAVSGGSDSIAVLHLMARLATHEGFALHAVTVDHALRSDSAAEAAWVAQICAGLAVPHQVLRWNHAAIAGNLMDAARRARYGMMSDWAAGQNVSDVLLGHTADDQAETFLMELARRAGIDGLVGMQPQWQQGGVRFLRPFLTIPRAALRDYLSRQGVGWLDDPSNDNDRFARVKARRALAVLKPLGITVAVLGGVMANLRAAQGAVLAATRDAAARICTERAGGVVFDRPQWAATGAEEQRRLLVAALRWISGAGYAPRGSAVDRVLMALAKGQGATLAGCRIRVSGNGFCVIREPRAVAGLVAAPEQLWDGRWQVRGPFTQGQEIRALGMAGLRQCKDWRATGYSRDALVVSPAIWYDEALIAAPLAGFPAGFDARIVASFNQFVLSH
ncbi:tRNA lysidine(34) synthetase TilS [Pseudorhodobacter sp.]|uniref:tRNA lysidine(34) synthetase TilS n=1 Tax=Pseudorhodobacter sp. TaxID=1934400 RepID=UPI002AFFBFC5|nr:tRNA lysidine(34) synthetase TilS [Pseudorhodobacter sp.]